MQFNPLSHSYCTPIIPAIAPPQGVCLLATVQQLSNPDCLNAAPPGSNDVPFPISNYTMIDCRQLDRTIYDQTVAAAKEIRFIAGTAMSRLSDSLGISNNYVIPSGKGNGWKPDNEGLYVMIHGLNGHPSIWDGHAKALKEQHPEAERRQVYVPKRGQTSLEKAARPIIEMVNDYITSNPGKPISLLGVSNGGRIAAYTERELRSTSSSIRVSSVAGVLFGTKLVNFLNDWGIAKLNLCKEVQQELGYGSKTAQQLLERLRDPLPKGNNVTRKFDFYATTEDVQLLPYTTALPRINKAEGHYVVHGEGHNSIVDRVRSHQLEQLIPWMKTTMLHKSPAAPMKF